jgi:glucosylceramidase
MFVFTFLLYLQKESSFMKNNFLSLLFILLNINFLNAQKINQIKVLTSSKPKIDAIAPIQKVENFPSEKAIQPLESEISIFINPSQKFQNIIGFGGAITDATAQTFANSIPQVQNKLLQMLFDQECGLSYNLIRTNMNSCDFSSESYTYIQENDTTLKTFDIAHDLKYKIPLLSRAMNMIGVQAKLYISPWSPPAFMKSNHQMKFGGKLLPKYYDLWAKYFVKYIQSIEKQGIPVWGLTIQNEPMATQIWESCIYTAEEERDFLKYNLGPVLKKNGLGNKKIIVWDHNRDLIYHRVNTILSDKIAANYVWGIGYHWYETWTGSPALHENLGIVSKEYPSKNLFFTEGCKEKFDLSKINDWEIGEKYATNMIEDFNQGVAGWTDWNMVLDENGGPNHVGNFCFAPIHVNLKDGQLNHDSDIYVTNAYHYIQHFSKYVKPEARKIGISVSRKSIMATAFINPDKSIVSIVLNKNNESLKYKVYLKNQMRELEIPARSMQTIIFK